MTDRTISIYVAKYRCVFDTDGAMQTIKSAILNLANTHPEITLIDFYDSGLSMPTPPPTTADDKEEVQE